MLFYVWNLVYYVVYLIVVLMKKWLIVFSLRRIYGLINKISRNGFRLDVVLDMYFIFMFKDLKLLCGYCGLYVCNRMKSFRL